MTHTLTRRQVSAIAKLDMSGLGHAQRIDAIAGALGYETGAALMATLKATEGTPPAGSQSAVPADPSAAPIRALVVAGTELARAVSDNEPIVDRNGDDLGGDVYLREFATEGELNAYAKGLEDSDGWLEIGMFANSVDEPDHGYLNAVAETPDLPFATWYTENRVAAAVAEALEEADADDEKMNEENPDRAGKPILGYQVDNFETGDNWGGHPSFEILTRETAMEHLKAALEHDSYLWRFLIVREGDIEDPTFE